MITRRQFLVLATIAPLNLRGDLYVFGDSIAEGYRLESGEAFAYALARGRRVVNLAIGASKVDKQVARSVAPGPADVCVWLTGYNDMRAGTDIAAYADTLASGAAQLVSRGARLYIGGCLRMPADGYALGAPVWSHGSDDAARAYDAAARAVTEAVPGCAYVPAHGAYNPDNVLWDRIHPNATGHAQIAGAFASVMYARVALPIV